MYKPQLLKVIFDRTLVLLRIFFFLHHRYKGFLISFFSILRKKFLISCADQVSSVIRSSQNASKWATYSKKKMHSRISAWNLCSTIDNNHTGLETCCYRTN